MKKIFFFTFIIIFFSQCNSVKNHNKQVEQLLSEKKLKSDTDFAYKKLKKLHPNLYWYISKEALDYKFDSLKTTITKPMRSFDFYKKISPIIASVRQGHMSVYPNMKRMTKKEGVALTRKGIGPFSQFDFEINDNKLYVLKNKSYNKAIQPGTEIVAINNQNPSELLQNYNMLFTSDGFNQTFKKSRLAKNFASYYSNENGIKDSIVYEFKFLDTLKTVTIKRQIVDSVKSEDKPAKKRLTVHEKKAKKEQQKAEKTKKSIYGYNEVNKNYNRNLRFIESDSSIAIMKINGFSIGNPYRFYRQSFKKIKDFKSKTLIIDLRDNPGGSLQEIAHLYSYLADSTFVFSQKSEVVSKTSLLQADYFKGGSLSTKALKVIFSPLYYGYTFFKVHKSEDGKYNYNTKDAKPQHVDLNAFKGKIYVLINGGSFSASCILSSNLKGSKRAFFVGQETGGAFNGTVAGRMPLIQLPNSKINVRVGLMCIKPFHSNDILGRGIFPDKEIVPTFDDKINDKDPELDWVLKDINANN